MRSLEPGAKATGMNIQHPAEQTNRPAAGIVTDKGVPQSDSLASRSSVARFSSFWSRRNPA
ncbi:hypothetical protein AT519_25890 [Escherichia coli]|nr:hypothetical protein [Escherichia coli]